MFFMLPSWSSYSPTYGCKKKITPFLLAHSLQCSRPWSFIYCFPPQVYYHFLVLRSIDYDIYWCCKLMYCCPALLFCAPKNRILEHTSVLSQRKPFFTFRATPPLRDFPNHNLRLCLVSRWCARFTMAHSNSGTPP